MFIWLQKIIPQSLISHWIGILADKNNLGKLKDQVIAYYIQHYHVNMKEAIESDYKQYATFNEFFTRRLKPGARLIDSNKESIVSPVDGCVSELGIIQENRLLQAKNIYYDLEKLLANSEEAKYFEQGNFLTAYLAPGDYHRIHLPISGQLLKMRYIPGKLFSVNPFTASRIPQLFALNERVICLFETPIGKMAVIAVAAIIVSGVFMHWHGTVTSPNKKIEEWDYSGKNMNFLRGDEMGYFKLGSTVIVLFEKNKMEWDAYLKPESRLWMGQAIGKIKTNAQCLSSSEWKWER